MPKGRFYSIGLHLIGWLVFFSLPVIFIISQSIENSSRIFPRNSFNFFGFVIYILIFYLHTYILIPKLYFGKRKVLYFLCIFLLLCAVLFLRPYDRLLVGSQIPASERSERNSPPIFKKDNPPPQNNIDLPGPPPFGQVAGNLSRSQHIDIISIVLFILVIVLSLSLILEKRWRMAVQ